jgi:DNA-binding protein YbaB
VSDESSTSAGADPIVDPEEEARQRREAAEAALRQRATDEAAAAARAEIARSEKFRGRVEALRVSAVRADGAVGVTVDGGGRLVALELQPAAKASGHEQLAADILRLNDEAAGIAGRQAVMLGIEEFGEGSATVRDLRERAGDLDAAEAGSAE